MVSIRAESTAAGCPRTFIDLRREEGAGKGMESNRGKGDGSAHDLRRFGGC